MPSFFVMFFFNTISFKTNSGNTTVFVVNDELTYNKYYSYTVSSNEFCFLVYVKPDSYYFIQHVGHQSVLRVVCDSISVREEHASKHSYYIHFTGVNKQLDVGCFT